MAAKKRQPVFDGIVSVDECKYVCVRILGLVLLPTNQTKKKKRRHIVHCNTRKLFISTLLKLFDVSYQQTVRFQITVYI